MDVVSKQRSPWARALEVMRGAPRTVQQFRNLGHLSSDLRALGWYDGDDLLSPRPWWTMNAISWIEQVVDQDMHVFEWGSGRSTLWLSRRVESVVAVEHDREWYAAISERIPSNARVLLSNSDLDAYLEPYESSRSADIVIVDGLYRNECCARAAQSPGNLLVVLDDSDRREYEQGHEALLAGGFQVFQHSGPKFGSGVYAATAVYARDMNYWLRRATQIERQNRY